MFNPFYVMWTFKSYFIYSIVKIYLNSYKQELLNDKFIVLMHLKIIENLYIFLSFFISNICRLSTKAIAQNFHFNSFQFAIKCFREHMMMMLTYIPWR